MTLRNAAIAALAIIVSALFIPFAGSAAELKDETSNAWQHYLDQQSQRVEHRALNTSEFFWVDADAKRYQRARAGVAVVEPVGKGSPLHVPSGLIHHWIGALFIPNATTDDVISVTRDYANYKEYFKPGVADAKPVSIAPDRDDFTIRFVNNSVLSKTSLEGSYTSQFFQLNSKRWYSVSSTRHMQEVRDAGEANESRHLPDQGSGYIWRLYSTVRIEEREGGVLLEIEAIALSRDIPLALHWFIDPMVKRISRDSLEKSLTETAAAARNHADACTVQNANSQARSSRIIVAGMCSRPRDSHNADYSDLRHERFPADSSR